jgi:hypothetical protein
MTNQNNKGFLETLASLENVYFSDYRNSHEPILTCFKGKRVNLKTGGFTSQEFLNLVETKEHYYVIEALAFRDNKYDILFQVLGKYDNKPNFNPADYVNFETNSIDFSDLKSSDFFEFYMSEIMAYVLANRGYVTDAEYDANMEKARKDSQLRVEERKNIITD